jgi:hypothetical protein
MPSKIQEMTPRGPKQIPVKETPRSLDSPLMNLPGILDSWVWWIHRGDWTPMWWIHRGAVTPCNIRRNLDFLEYLALASVFANQFRSTLRYIQQKGVSTVWSWNTRVSRPHGCEYPGESWFRVVITPGSRLRIHITPWKFNEIKNPF